MSSLEQLSVHGFRSIEQLELVPGPICALVGEAKAGKSNLLAAIRAVLDPAVALDAGDVPRSGGEAEIVARLSSGEVVTLGGGPAPPRRSGTDNAPPVIFLPAELRGSRLLAGDVTSARVSPVRALFDTALAERVEPTEHGSRAAPALSLIDALHACLECSIASVVLLVEEPELFLRPQGQRYLYRLLRQFAAHGNQVIYTTHAPAFLNVARLDELVFIERPRGSGTRAVDPPVPTPDEDFRVLSEFDAERAELLLSRAAILVEGQTEKLALPFVFAALGHDLDRAGITIVECGGKWNIPLFARVCRAAGVPFVAVYDRDAPPGRRPSASNRAVAATITALAGPERTVELAPDFEAVAGLQQHRQGKPRTAWQHFAALDADRIPAALVQVVERTLAACSGGAGPSGAEAPEP